MSSPFPVTMLPYTPIHRPIHNVVESLLLIVLARQPMLQVALPPSCQPWQKKLRKSGNDYAQSQPRVKQERLKKSSIGNLDRFNQNRFRLKRLIPIERDLNGTLQVTVYLFPVCSCLALPIFLVTSPFNACYASCLRC